PDQFRGEEVQCPRCGRIFLPGADSPPLSREELPPDSLTLQVTVHTRDGQKAGTLARPLNTTLAAVLWEVLARHGLAGGTNEWVPVYQGVLVEWGQTLQDLFSLVQQVNPSGGGVPLVIVRRELSLEQIRAVVRKPPPPPEPEQVNLGQGTQVEGVATE